MTIKKIAILLSLVSVASIVTAQTERVIKEDTIVVKQKHYTASSPDLPNDYKEFLELSRKYPNRGVFFPEDFGEQLTDSTKEELLRRLAMSKDSIELRKIAQVLGDREMAGTLKLTDKEIIIVENRIRAYIREKADFYG